MPDHMLFSDLKRKTSLKAPLPEVMLRVFSAYPQYKKISVALECADCEPLTAKLLAAYDKCSLLSIVAPETRYDYSLQLLGPFEAKQSRDADNPYPYRIYFTIHPDSNVNDLADLLGVNLSVRLGDYPDEVVTDASGLSFQEVSHRCFNRSQGVPGGVPLSQSWYPNW